MEIRRIDNLANKRFDFEPRIPGLWNFRFVDSGTGTTVFRAESPFGEKAVKFFNMEGSEKVDILSVRNYQRSVKKVSDWMNGLRQDLSQEVFVDKAKTFKIVWSVNVIQMVGDQSSNGKKIPYSISPWVNGFPLSDIFDGKTFPGELGDFDKPKLLGWLRERLDLKRRQHSMVNPYSATKEFIPVARNILLVPGIKNLHKLIVVDIRDYLNPRRNPLKNLARFRTLGN